jgi:hypothetical protein
MSAPTMPVSGEIAREFSLPATVTRIGPRASSMVRVPQLEYARDVASPSISRRWNAQERWRPGSALRATAPFPKCIRLHLRGNRT